MSIWPAQVAVGPGESWLINCSTSCAQPETGGLETLLSKNLLAKGMGWMQFEVANASSDTIIYCYFICSGEQRSQSLNVTVFREWQFQALPSHTEPRGCWVPVCVCMLGGTKSPSSKY